MGRQWRRKPGPDPGTGASELFSLSSASGVAVEMYKLDAIPSQYQVSACEAVQTSNEGVLMVPD